MTRNKKIAMIRTWVPALAATSALGLLIYFLQAYYPPAVDWEYSFSPLSEHWRDPFVIPSFTNPPWVIAFLPHAWLPLKLGNAINLFLNIAVILAVIRRFGGGWKLMLLVFTSPNFFDLARTNNVDWIPMLALLIPNSFGLPLLVIKPQALGGVALIWWKRNKFSWKMLLPLTVVLAASFLMWGAWPLRTGLPENVAWWNFAPWPLGILLGLYMLWRAYQENDEILAAAATPFLVPYIAPYSITALLAMAGGRYKKEVFFAYISFWIYVVVESRRIGML